MPNSPAVSTTDDARNLPITLNERAEDNMEMHLGRRFLPGSQKKNSKRVQETILTVWHLCIIRSRRVAKLRDHSQIRK